MEERRDESSSPTQQGSSSATASWPSELAERVKSLSFESQGEALSKESPRSVEQDCSPGQRASQHLWDTGMLSEPIPNGFYSVVPVSDMSVFRFSYFLRLYSCHMERWLSFLWGSLLVGRYSFWCKTFLQDKRVKELYNRLPTPSELYALGEEGVRIEIILVDFQKDKKLAMLKQLITTLVSGSNPALVIKKIAGTVGIL